MKHAMGFLIVVEADDVTNAYANNRVVYDNGVRVDIGAINEKSISILRREKSLLGSCINS